MTRLLIIFAIVCTGLAPMASCWSATTAPVAAVAASSCATVCCGATCCCVAESDPVPVRDAPATPPRGSDVVPITLLIASPIAMAWDDEAQPCPSLDTGYADRVLPREPRAVQPLICRWLT